MQDNSFHLDLFVHSLNTPKLLSMHLHVFSYSYWLETELQMILLVLGMYFIVSLCGALQICSVYSFYLQMHQSWCVCRNSQCSFFKFSLISHVFFLYSLSYYFDILHHNGDRYADALMCMLIHCHPSLAYDSLGRFFNRKSLSLISEHDNILKIVFVWFLCIARGLLCMWCKGTTYSHLFVLSHGCGNTTHHFLMCTWKLQNMAFS